MTTGTTGTTTGTTEPMTREGPPRYFLAMSLLTPTGWIGGPVGYTEVTKAEAERARAPRPEQSKDEKP